MELALEVLIDADLPTLINDAICYETGLTRAQAADPSLYAYEHHGSSFGAVDPGALTSLYEDMIQGRPMPMKFATHAIKGIDTLFAIALFIHRDMATHPAMPAIVAQVDLVHRRGLPMYGHIDTDLARFFRMLGAMFPPSLSKDERGNRLRVAIGWIYEYVTQANLPHLGSELVPPRVIDVGTNGFVVAEAVDDDLAAGWVELYRQGHVRGVLVGQEREGRRKVLASRKSVYVDFNLTRAASLLNEIEAVMGEPPEWEADELWLKSPPDGTLMLVTHMMEVFLRV